MASKSTNKSRVHYILKVYKPIYEKTKISKERCIMDLGSEWIGLQHGYDQLNGILANLAGLIT